MKMNLALFLSLLLVSVPVLPAEPSAAVGKLTTHGAAAVNGTVLPNDATVFSGDRLATEKNSSVALSLGTGNQVFFPELTLAKVERNGSGTKVLLERGALAVVSRLGIVPVVETGGVRIETTVKSPAVFEVAISGKALKVIARSGAMHVIAAGRTVEVPEGKMMEATVAPGPDSNSPAAGTGMGSNLTGVQIAAIGIGLASGVSGLILGVVAANRPSPQDCKVTGSSPATITCP
jgi:hypothetical protein